MPCCESTLAMVMTAIRRPAAEVWGWFQIFEMEFIRKAPCKKKGGHGRLGIWDLTGAEEAKAVSAQ
jgi:hypothetical protein